MKLSALSQKRDWTIVLIFLAVWLLVLALGPSGFKEASEIFQSIGIGAGALLGGTGARAAFADWAKRKRGEAYIKDLKGRYPRERLNETFRIVNKPGVRGYVYLLDIEGQKRFWIKTPQALSDLDFSFLDAKDILDEEFQGYSEGKALVAAQDVL